MELRPELTGNSEVDTALDKFADQLRPLVEKIHFGLNSPNGVVVGNPGDIYLDTGGGAGTAFWVKEAGVGTTANWVAK